MGQAAYGIGIYTAPGGLPDEEWIEALGREGGWSVLSGDIRIAKKRPSRDLFLRANLTGFFPLSAMMALPLRYLQRELRNELKNRSG